MGYWMVVAMTFSLLGLNSPSQAVEVWTGTVSYPGETCGSPQIHVRLIQPGDADRFEDQVKKLKISSRDACSGIKASVFLNSDGGSLDAALELGRKIRQYETVVYVANGGHCYSACVFLLAAGVQRYGHAGVGIHRPYFEQLEAGVSIDQIRTKRENTNARIVQYLKDMDISIRLLDSMLAVPPDEIKVLTKSELQEYRLYGVDANWDERTVAEAARRVAMTSSEYRLRDKQRSDAVDACIIKPRPCPEFYDLSAFWGISTKVARARAELVKQICGDVKDPKFPMCANRIFKTGR
jgi:Clp protease